MNRLRRLLVFIPIVGMALGNTPSVATNLPEKKNEEEAPQTKEDGMKKIKATLRINDGKNGTEKNDTKGQDFKVTIVGSGESIRIPKQGKVIFRSVVEHKKNTYLKIVKIFIFVYLTLGFLFNLGGQEPEVLTMIGFVTLYIKYKM